MGRGTKIAYALIMIMTVLLVGAGCASSGGDRGSAAAAPAAPAAPAKKAFTPPAFDATEFKSEEHSFSVHYPSDYATETPQAPTGVLTAASPSMVPRIDVTVVPDPGTATLEEAGALVASNLGTVGGGEAKVTSSKETTLQDGVTEAQEFVVEWAFQGFPLQSVVLNVTSDGNIVNVMATGMAGGDTAELSEIAYTLYFND